MADSDYTTTNSSSFGSTSVWNSLDGGLPTISQDFVISNVFILLYLIALVLCSTRMVAQYRRPRRMWTAYLPLLLFTILRVVTMILRFVGAVNFRGALLEENAFSKGLLIAQQLLLSTCYIMPAFTLSHLTVFHELRGTGWTTHARHHVVHILDVVLVAATALGIVSASEYSKGLTASDTADMVQTFRDASSITTAAVLVLLTVYNTVLAMRPKLPRSTSLWLCLTSLCLAIPFAYRLYRSFNPSPSDISTSSATKIEFYALEMGVEYIVVLSLLAVNAKEWCGVLDEHELPESVYGMYDGSKTRSEGSLLLQPRTV